MNAGFKDCPGCSERHRLSEFYRNATRTDGLHVWCKACERASIQRRRERDPVLYSRLSRRSRYGLADGEFEGRLEAQGGCCASCGDTLDLVNPRLTHVDHCHATGKVRGLLCIHCNWAVGNLKDDPNRARRLIAYLEAA